MAQSTEDRYERFAAAPPLVETLPTIARIEHMKTIAQEIAFAVAGQSKPMHVSDVMDKIDKSLSRKMGTLDSTSLSYGLNYGLRHGFFTVSPDGVHIIA